MVTREAIQDAIRETEGLPDSYTKAQRLATFLTLKNLLYPDPMEPLEIRSSYDAPPTADDHAVVGRYGDGEFYRAIEGKGAKEAWETMGELMDTLQIVNPRLYAGVMRKLQ